MQSINSSYSGLSVDHVRVGEPRYTAISMVGDQRDWRIYLHDLRWPLRTLTLTSIVPSELSVMGGACTDELMWKNDL